MEGNNLSGKIAQDRDNWMHMEGNLYDELTNNPENIKKITEYNKISAHILYDRVLDLINEIESGKLENEKIYENVEEITLLFVAMEDVQRKKVRERFRDSLRMNPNLAREDRIQRILKMLRGETTTYQDNKNKEYDGLTR